MGLVAVDDLLVVICADDILAAGVQGSQDQFWAALQTEIQLDGVEDIFEFPPKFHHLEPGRCRLNMIDYRKQAVSFYLEVAGVKTVLRKLSTPCVSEGTLADKDCGVQERSR